MEERDKDCEENCFYFAALSPEQKISNREARSAALKGEEFPGSANTLCGGCVKMKKIESCLDNKIRELFSSGN
jgi:hypothetical protein